MSIQFSRRVLRHETIRCTALPRCLAAIVVATILLVVRRLSESSPRPTRDADFSRREKEAGGYHNGLRSPNSVGISSATVGWM